ncbi:MAG: acetolactate synthase [Armatimonadetes bacterium]|nr:acetolactate synthase [Armatimonadota bacterium]
MTSVGSGATEPQSGRASVHGGRHVASALRRAGVEVLFTLCGGHIMHIYDGCLDEGIRVVDVRHEQAAVFAADAWARLTGRPGAAAVTAGPGVCNSVTAIANAWRAQSPVVVIGGQGPIATQGQGSLQEMDHISVLRPITKWAVQVPETSRLGEIVALACRRAIAGVPGPVYVEAPLDVLMGSSRLRPGEPLPPRAATPGDPGAVETAARLLREAGRPALLVGSQVRWSPDHAAVRRFAEAAQVPVYASGMARGVLPLEHPLAYAHSRRQALKQADVVLVAGTPLDFRLNYGEAISGSAALIQVDLDSSELGRNREPAVGIVGDAGVVLDQIAQCGAAPLERDARARWLEGLRAIECEACSAMEAGMGSDATPVDPLRLCAEVNRWLRDDATVVGDGGDFISTASYIVRPRRYPAGWMDPGPLGTLGIGPGFALAARLARPDGQVVLLLGDGAAGLDLLEFEAAVRQGIPFVAVVGNDAAWTQIRRLQIQVFGQERAVASALGRARYDRVVAEMGGWGERATRPDELRPALDRAFESGLPSLVNVEMGASGFRAGSIGV